MGAKLDAMKAAERTHGSGEERYRPESRAGRKMGLLKPSQKKLATQAGASA